MSEAVIKKTYLHIPVYGPAEAFEVEQGDELGELQRRVGGYITSAGRLIKGHTMYVDDEGLLKGYLFNTRAVQLARQALVGDAVLVGPVDDEGETWSVDTALMRQIMDMPYVTVDDDDDEEEEV